MKNKGSINRRLAGQLSELCRKGAGMKGTKKQTAPLNKEFYRTIFETSSDALLLVDLEGRIRECNPEACNFLGYSRNELLRLKATTLLPDLLSKHIPDMIDEISSTESPFIWIAAKRKDGRIVPAEGNIKIITAGGENLLYACIRHAAPLKSTQILLREGEITWRRRDDDFVMLGFSTAIEEVKSRIAQDYVGKKASEILQSRPDLLKDLRECFDRKTSLRKEVSFRVDADSDLTHLSLTYIFVEPHFVITHMEDITKEIMARNALRESERRLSTLMDNLPGLAYRCLNDEHWTMQYISGGCLGITGYEAADLYESKQLRLRDLVHPDDYESVREQRQEALRDRKPYMLEYRVVTASGDKKWVLERGTGIYDEKGTLVALEGLITDIDDRKAAATTLRNERDLILNYLEMTGTIIAVINEDQKVILVNKKGCEILGYDGEELIGKNWFDTCIAEREREEARDLFLRVMAGKRKPADYVERTVLTRKGEEKVITWHSSVIKNAVFNISGLLISGEDITAQKRAEAELRKSEQDLRELSSKLIEAEENVRRRISRELHDSLGQYLTTIKVGAENAMHQLREDSRTSCVELLKQQVSLIQGAIEEVRRISRDLRPSMLDDLGIVATISWFCREFQAAYPRIRIEKTIDVSEKEIPDDLKIVIYRILQEACNNTAKYGRASHIGIHLSRIEDRIELIIEDNGKGFNLRKILTTESPRKGLGLESMKERTQFSQGSFHVSSRIGKGTKIHSSWPCQPIC